MWLKCILQKIQKILVLLEFSLLLLQVDSIKITRFKLVKISSKLFVEFSFVQKLKQVIKLFKIVLQRCSTQQNSKTSPQSLALLKDFAIVIFYALPFV